MSRTSNPSAEGRGSRTDHVSAWGPNIAITCGPTTSSEDRTHDGRKYRMLNVIDEFKHESLAIRVARKFEAMDVLAKLTFLPG